MPRAFGIDHQNLAELAGTDSIETGFYMPGNSVPEARHWMKPNRLIWAVAMLPLLLGGPASAGSPAALARADIASAAAQPNGLGGSLLHRVQATDPRVGQLEEQVRQLTGKVEELTFMILQMQDQVRKMQEDNEFRFQQLEEKRSDAGTTAAERRTAEAGPPARGDPPRTLGTIDFDADGNPTGGVAATDEGTLPGVEIAKPDGGDTDGTVVAALPDTNDPEELYRNAYSFILSGDYPTAEAGFREHIARFPNDAKAPDAHYWLGEALLGMEQYRSAAEVFLNASRDYADSRKAPDMLLKLGVSLAALNQRDVACATYLEIGKRYRDISPALKERVKAEQALAGC